MDNQPVFMWESIKDHLSLQGCRGHEASGGSSKVSLGPGILCYSTLFGWPTPDWPYSLLGVGRQQDELSIFGTKILNSGVGCPLSVDSKRHGGFMDPRISQLLRLCSSSLIDETKPSSFTNISIAS
jgi:hypothetical protein